MALLVECLIVLLFVCLLIWWQNNPSPQRIEQYHNQEPLISLPRFGFKRGQANTERSSFIWYEDQINGYQAKILFDWQTGWLSQHPHYSIRIFYTTAAVPAGEHQASRIDDTWQLTETFLEKRLYVGRFKQITAQQLSETAYQGVREARKVAGGTLSE